VPSSPQSPQAVRGGLVLLDLSPRRIVRSAVFQYNPELLYRTLVPAPNGNGAVEVVELELELDATGEPQAPLGIQPQLAALESIAFPTRSLAKAPLTVLVWGQARVLPVRVTELLVTEEAFDLVLHPIRATVAATMEALAAPRRSPAAAEEWQKSEHRLVRQEQADRERLAKRGAGALDALGIDPARL
jgi:hypothetical protein